MIKFKLDLGIMEKEIGGKKAVVVSGPYEVTGKDVTHEEVLAIATALANAIEPLMPEIEKLPGDGPLRFVSALNRPIVEWARKQ